MLHHNGLASLGWLDWATRLDYNLGEKKDAKKFKKEVLVFIVLINPAFQLQQF
jgi:hypothetical protein